ncbi:MAG: TIGR01459 family HAD-type hydrolase [Alphaproteobacteria bacterium]|nr:TIGR01459 family HAD-type hydrolase [Alphaproteobacteria bacterium]
MTAIAGLGPVAEKYDAFILDLWGVVHDGHRPFPGTVDCMRRLRAQGKPVILLSNAPRRSESVEDFLRQKIGLPEGCHDHIITSGDLTHAHLARRAEGWRSYLRVGPERDWGLLDDLDYRRVETPAAADFMLCTGLVDDEKEEPQDYDRIFREAIALGLVMVCANPDLTVMRGNVRVYCAGALAARYEALGGRVIQHGKPYPDAYAACRALLGPARTRLLAVGDSLRTDIAGAHAAGIDSVLVACGIHAEEWGVRAGEMPDPARIEAAIGDGPRPTYLAAELRW